MYEHLSCKYHIIELCNKLSRTSSIFFKLRHHCPLQNLINLYNSLFSSFLIYGLIAWGVTFVSYLNPLFKLQKKVLCCIKFERFSGPSLPIFQSLRTLKLEDALHLNILTFVYKAINRLAPSQFHNYFHPNTNVHKIGTCRQPEVISLNSLKILLLCMVFRQFNIFVLNSGTHFPYSSVLLALSQFFDPK